MNNQETPCSMLCNPTEGDCLRRSGIWKIVAATDPQLTSGMTVPQLEWLYMESRLGDLGCRIVDLANGITEGIIDK